MTVEEILRMMRSRRDCQRITRYRYKIDVAEALRTIETIGKQMIPTFHLDDDNRFTYENFAKWCNGDETMQCLDPATGEIRQGNMHRGIYLAGGIGTGKSWCLNIMRIYCAILGIHVLLPDARDTNDQSLLVWRTERADAICDEYMQTGDIKQFKRCPLLGIQDFGSEATETIYMGNRMEVIKNLLESRGDDIDKITLITSNIKPNDEDLVERYGERVVSRLREMCNYLEIKGRDRRY